MTTPVQSHPLPSGRPTEAQTPKGVVRPGDRVVLWPAPGGDIFDLALSGKTGIVEGIEQDFEGRTYLAVVVEDDPGQDLGRLRKPGHRFFFRTDEVAPLADQQEPVAPAGRGKRVLVAGLGNVFLGDDAFGVEVAHRLMADPPGGDVRVVDFGIRSVGLVYTLLEGYDLVILLDAVSRGGQPGTLYVIEPEPPAEAPGPPPVMLDPHDLDVVKVLAWVASAGGHVGRLLVVGCEPTPIDAAGDISAGLSEPVAQAVEKAAELTRKLIDDELTAGAAAQSRVGDDIPPARRQTTAAVAPNGYKGA